LHRLWFVWYNLFDSNDAIMAITIIGQKKTSTTIQVYSDQDAKALQAYPVNMLLNMKVTGSRKERAYRELCCYFGSCQYIADQNFNTDMNTQDKVDHMTRIQENFVSDIIYDRIGKRTLWMTKHLDYQSCDQPDSHRFIVGALERHAALVGCNNADDYILLLNSQK